MEVILWTILWNEFESEFENEKNLLGGSLGEKAAEDLKQRVIEHVSFSFSNLYFPMILQKIRLVIISLFIYLFCFFCFLGRTYWLSQSTTRGSP